MRISAIFVGVRGLFEWGARERISRRFRRVRASAFAVSMRWVLALGVSLRVGRDLRARVRIFLRASGVRGSRMMTSQRLKSAELISKEGFSVVAPMRVRVPDSMWGSILSCWDLFQRWISSKKRMVWVPERRRFSATWTSFFRSAMPLVTAERAVKWEEVLRAMRRARVVFPLPGGPQKMRLWSWFFSVRWRRRPSDWVRRSWPKTSVHWVGRRRSARGADCCLMGSKRSMVLF